MMSNSVTGGRDYQSIKLNLKSSHYWNLFDCYYQNISIGIIRPILGTVDHCPKEKLACVLYYLAPLIIGGKNPQLITSILQIGQMAVTQHPDESVLDIMSSVREGSLFAIDYLVLPFYKAQKEIARNVYKERGIYEEPNKSFLLLEDIRNIFNLSVMGQEVIESRECDLFLNHHIRNPGMLEDTLDFFSLKLNVDRSLTTSARLKIDLEFINTFCLENDEDTLPTRIQFHNDTISNIFVIGTQSLKIDRQEAALVFDVVFQSLRKVFEKLKNGKIVDKEFVNLVDLGVSMMIEKLCYVPELCQNLIVLLYDIKIHNNQIAIDSNLYEYSELEMMKVAFAISKIQRVRQMTIFGLSSKEEIEDLVKELDGENNKNISKYVHIDKCYCYIKLKYMMKYRKSLKNPNGSDLELEEEFKKTLDYIIKKIKDNEERVFEKTYMLLTLREFYQIGKDAALSKENLEEASEFAGLLMHNSLDLLGMNNCQEYRETYDQDVKILSNIDSKLKQLHMKKNFITYGVIFLGVIGIAAAASYFLFKEDKKD